MVLKIKTSPLSSLHVAPGGNLPASSIKPQLYQFETTAWMVCVVVTVETPVMMPSGRLATGLSRAVCQTNKSSGGIWPGSVWALILSNWLQMLQQRGGERERETQRENERWERCSLKLQFLPVCFFFKLKFIKRISLEDYKDLTRYQHKHCQPHEFAATVTQLVYGWTLNGSI